MEISPLTILSYLDQTIQILFNLKTQPSKPSEISSIEIPKEYEELVQKLEGDVWMHIRVEQQMWLHIENM